MSGEPYFVPAISIVGISGVYVRLRWPITDVRVVGRIFFTGPTVGFTASALLYLAGLPLSTYEPIADEYLVLGDSLLTTAAVRVIVPQNGTADSLVLHPIALAGYFGFFFNMWQLLPIGRFDAGRVVYAAFGYRKASIVSWTTVAILFVLATLGTISATWLSVAIFGALTMIRLAKQHPPDAIVPPLDRTTTYWLLAMFGILVVIFVPVPVRLGP